MNDKKNFEFYIQDSNFPFSGWDFSHIEKRMIMAPLTWSYTSKIIPYMKNSSRLLDIGTGGGEFLSSLNRYLPKETHATELYEPNFKLAEERLKDLGIKVHHVDSKSKIPFNDDFFDLVISRHANYDPKEVYRILKKEGNFITQEVGSKNDYQIKLLLQGQVKSETNRNEGNVDYNSKKLEEVGFRIIEKKEDFPKTRIYDIGALIYWLKAIHWIIEDFSVDKYKEDLYRVHKLIGKNGFIDPQSHRFFIIAQKDEN